MASPLHLTFESNLCRPLKPERIKWPVPMQTNLIFLALKTDGRLSGACVGWLGSQHMWRYDVVIRLSRYSCVSIKTVMSGTHRPSEGTKWTHIVYVGKYQIFMVGLGIIFMKTRSRKRRCGGFEYKWLSKVWSSIAPGLLTKILQNMRCTEECDCYAYQVNYTSLP